MIEAQRGRLSSLDASQAPVLAREDLDRLTQFFRILMAWGERHARDVFRGACGNVYIREERLSELLAGTVQAIQIPATVADQIAAARRDDDGQAEQARLEARQRLADRRRKVLAKLDRGYEDFLDARITEDFWNRKSGDWEEERRTLETELARLAQANGQITVTANKILELAKSAGFLYKTQDPAEQRRLLETVLSNCTFDRGTLCPTYSKPFDLFAQGNETGNWRGVWDEFRNWLRRAARGCV
jgi:hypothetical protein